MSCFSAKAEEWLTALDRGLHNGTEVASNFGQEGDNSGIGFCQVDWRTYFLIHNFAKNCFIWVVIKTQMGIAVFCTNIPVQRKECSKSTKWMLLPCKTCKTIVQQFLLKPSITYSTFCHARRVTSKSYFAKANYVQQFLLKHSQLLIHEHFARSGFQDAEAFQNRTAARKLATRFISQMKIWISETWRKTPSCLRPENFWAKEISRSLFNKNENKNKHLEKEWAPILGHWYQQVRKIMIFLDVRNWSINLILNTQQFLLMQEIGV